MSTEPLITAITVSKSIQDSDLATLAISSSVAAYVRSLTTNASRSSTQQALTIAADILAPGFLPASKGPGRNGNGSERFAKTCQIPFHLLRTDRLAELRAELLRSGSSTSTINKVLAAVKGVLYQCWKSQLVDGETLARAKASLTVVKGTTIQKGRHLTKMELAKIFRAIAKTENPAAARDAALLALLCIGLRRAEVASVGLKDYQAGSGRLVVHGKGNKERAVFLTNGAKSAIDHWILLRGEVLSNALLLQVNKGGKIIDAGITAQSVYSVLLKRSAESGVLCSPHDLRRTFAGECLNSGIDIVTVQHLMGHSSPTTTARYDRRPEEARKLAMAAISVPYVHPTISKNKEEKREISELRDVIRSILTR